MILKQVFNVIVVNDGPSLNILLSFKAKVFDRGHWPT